MTVRAPMLNDVTDTRQDFRQAFGGLLVPASALTSRGGFVPDGGGVLSAASGMQMSLAPARVYVQGGSASSQGVYPVIVTAAETVTLANGGAANRIDLVVVRIRDNDADGSGSTTATVEVVTGSSPTVPPAVPTSAVAAWEVTVPAGRTAGNGGLSGTDITKDRRLYTTALGGVTPSGTATDVTGVYKGQMRWRTDTSSLEVWDGTAWKPLAEPLTSYRVGGSFAVLRCTTALSVIASTWVNISFDTADEDPDGGYSAGSPFVWTAPRSGMWHVDAIVAWPNTAMDVLVAISTTATTRIWRAGARISATGAGYSPVCVSGLVRMSAGQQVGVQAWHNAGSSQALATNAPATTMLCVSRVGA